MSTPKRFTRLEKAPEVNRVIPIRRVGPTDRLRLICLSHKVQHFQFHWDDGFTKPCTMGEEMCQRCLREVPRKYYGFLHSMELDSDAQCFLQLTAFAVKRFEKICDGMATMRGLQIEAYRERSTLRGPICVNVVNALWIHKEWPKEKDVEPTLRVVFRY